jgi:hypothetical protein
MAIVSHVHGRRPVMFRRLRWVWIAPGLLAALALSGGSAAAADKTKVDQATRRVERGAKQIGQGQVGAGFREMFTGIGHTVAEGAKFSGENIKEFFAAPKPGGKPARSPKAQSGPARNTSRSSTEG